MTAQNPDSPVTSEKNRILVVDDDPINRMVIEELLEDEPYRLAMAESGEQALELAAEFRPDLILLDVMMPGLNGYETCQRFREHDTRGTKIVMVSAKAMVSERLQGFEAGANDYVSKPFNHDQLVAKIELLLRLKSVEEADWFEPRFLELMDEDLWRSILDFEESDARSGALDAAGGAAGDAVVERCARCLELLDRLEQICKLKRPGSVLPTGALDLVELTRAAVRDFETHRADGDGAGIHEVECRTPDSLVLEGNAERLEFLIGTLLENASESSCPGEAIVLEIDREGDLATLSVTYRARGLDPGCSAAIFDEYRRENWTSGSRPGPLSLALCRVIAERHGGTIELRSGAEAERCFTLRLGLAKG